MTFSVEHLARALSFIRLDRCLTAAGDVELAMVFSLAVDTIAVVSIARPLKDLELGNDKQVKLD